MKKKYLISLISLFMMLGSHSILAADLIQVYQRALKHDPSFKASESIWLANRENIPIARSALLPNLSAEGYIARTHADISGQGGGNPTSPGFGSGTFDFVEKQYSINLSQPLFNVASWKSLRHAQAGARQAQATYSAAAQDLMIRVARAYFNVLYAYDVLRFTRAQKIASARQLDETQQRYKVGLMAITNVYEAQAQYDSYVAQEIGAQTAVANNLEALRQITNCYYPSLQGLERLPLLSPKPNNIERWVSVATQQNYQLLAQRFGVLAARENIKVQEAGHLPTVNGVASYYYSNTLFINPQAAAGPPIPGPITAGSASSSAATSALDEALFTTQKVGSIGVNAQFPVYQGGYVVAKTRQAVHQYAQADAQLEQLYRSTVASTRNAFLGVLSGVSQIKADRQAILSTTSAVNAAEAGYEVGTRTIVDVLVQRSNLYNAQKQYAYDQYQYILNTLLLKQAAGTLCAQDIVRVNSWLKEKIQVDVLMPGTKQTYGEVTNQPPPRPPVPRSANGMPLVSFPDMIPKWLPKDRPGLKRNKT